MGMRIRHLGCIAVILITAGCQSAYLKSVGGDPNQSFVRIFPSSYNLVWDSTLEVFKTTPLETVNRENGAIETQWVDNTAERNLLEASGTPTAYTKARYKFKVILGQGFYDGRQSVRVSVTKMQQVERDVLEGFQSIDTDGVQERTLLYRLGQIVAVKKKLGRIEEERLKRQIKEAQKGASTKPKMEDLSPAPAAPTSNDPDLDAPPPAAPESP